MKGSNMVDASKRSEVLEMEPMQVESSGLQTRSTAPSPSNRFSQLILLIKLHIERYPGVASAVAGVIVMIVFFMFILSFHNKPATRNELYRDYSKIDMDYTFKSSEVDHWCLWGGNEDCACGEFNEPMPRGEQKGWLKTHNANVRRIDVEMDYDVVFLGDETVEGWNGTGLNLPRPDGIKIRKYFSKTFTKEGGGRFDGLAMGVQGDVSPNLLWRLRHGEMPLALNSKVYWLSIGMNDLIRDGCSEEVALLGILRLADEIYFHNKYSVIVINGILPWTNNPDGSLAMSATHHRSHVFGGHDVQKSYNNKDKKKNSFLWPSIKRINSQLKSFCAQHEHLVYFDASALFLGSIGNKYYKQPDQHIITDLLTHGKTLSYDGYKVWGDAIRNELGRIIYEGDESNDIEVKGGN